MLRRSVRRLGSTNRYTDGSGRKLDTNILPRDLYVPSISNRAYPQETEHWQVAVAGEQSPFKGNVIISGAGVVGSTTAAMFSLRGWHVTVIEQKPSPAERMEAEADAVAGRVTSSSTNNTNVTTDAYDEIDCALLTRRGLDIFAAAGVPLEHLRHFGVKVEGVMEHPSGYNTILTRSLTEEHPFAVNMLSLDMARLREHLDTHLSRLPGGNCRVFYNHQAVAAFPEKKKLVVKSLDEIEAEKKEREEWNRKHDEAMAARNAGGNANNTTSDANSAPIDSTPYNTTGALATTGPSALLRTSINDDKGNFDGLHYDLLIDAEGAASRLRDMLDVEGFASDKIYGMKWFALDEVVEVTRSGFTRTSWDDDNGSTMRSSSTFASHASGEFHRNPNYSKDGRNKQQQHSYLEEDEYGKVTKREKLRILMGDEERKKEAVRRGARFDDDGEEVGDSKKASSPSSSGAPSSSSSLNVDEELGPNQRHFYLEHSHIHRWSYPCPKGTKNTALCMAFPRRRSAISTAAGNNNKDDGADFSSPIAETSTATTVKNADGSTTTTYRNSYAVMAYFPMSVLRKLSDEEFLETYLQDLAFQRKGFMRAAKHDEFNTEGVNDGVSDDLLAEKKGDDPLFDDDDINADETRVSYFELETPSKPKSAAVARFSTRGKITPYPTIFCEDLYNGVGLPSAVVVGDAAHNVNPFLMQGLSAALEDSSILLNQLDAISRHFYDSVKQYSRERGVAGDTLRLITDRSLFYNRQKHVNPFIRFRNAYTRFMYRMMPRYYNEFYSTNMNHLYPRSVEWMLNGRGYTSYEKTEMTQTKLQRWFYIGRNYT